MLEEFRSSGWSQTNVLSSVELGDDMMNLIKYSPCLLQRHIRLGRGRLYSYSLLTKMTALKKNHHLNWGLLDSQLKVTQLLPFL